MLQPLQLKEVSVRYAGEIAELRDFLAKAGVPVKTAEALRVIAARVREDRGFHRDLISYVWVVIDSTGRKIGYSDLLGVLAIAAAGEQFAAAADEDAAHDVLRFLMEAKHELDGVAGTPAREQSAGRRFLGPEEVAPVVASVPIASAPPLTSASPVVAPSLHSPALREDAQEEILLRPVQVERGEISSAEIEEGPGARRRRVLWLSLIVLFVIAALLLVWWMYFRPAENATRAPVVMTQQGSDASTAAVNDEVSGARSSDAGETIEPAQTETHASAGRGGMRAQPSVASRANVRTPTIMQESAVSMPSRATGVSPLPAPPASAVASAHTPTSAPRTAPVSAAPVVRSATPSSGAVPIRIAPRTTANPGPVVVPADALSKRVGVRSIPEDLEPYGIEASGRKHPVLKRRVPEGSSLVAEANVPARPGSAPASAGTARAGVVRTGTEGTMSASVLYSPAPAYPAAASAAHVEGQVRVQASIDRDGTVAAARVISGPPLLRDAALDAVHHWRFRPRVSHGKPAPSSATAVLDFELP